MVSLLLAPWLMLGCPSGEPSTDGPGGTTGRVEDSSITADTSAPTGDTADSGASGPPTTTYESWLVAPSSEGGLHTPFLARDPSSGALYATWGTRGDDGFTRIWIAASTDDGETFSSPQQVSAPMHDATASFPEGPVLTLGPDHLYLTYGAHELGGTPYTLYVLKAPLPPLPAGTTPPAVPLDMGLATRIVQPMNYSSMNYPTLAIGPDGLAWLALVASPVYDGRVWVSREVLGWAVEDVTASSPLSEPPCECCPPAFGMDPSGRVLVGWRGDIEKDLFIAESDGSGPFGGHRRITDTGIADLICPQDGMEFVHLDGAMHLAWSDARPAAGRGFVSTEGPDGWTHEPILTDSVEVQARVGAVPTDDGLLTHWDNGWGGDAYTALVGSRRGQRVAADQGGPLGQLRAIATPSGPLGIGIDDAGSIWLVRLDRPLPDPDVRQRTAPP